VRNAAILDPAAKEFGEFRIDDEAEAAGEIVAAEDAVTLKGNGAGVGAEGPGARGGSGGRSRSAASRSLAGWRQRPRVKAAIRG
jgi:hypothetical protein